MKKIEKFEKIEIGMRLIAEGCDEVHNWEECRLCPFGDYCEWLIREARERGFDDFSIDMLFSREEN